MSETGNNDADVIIIGAGPAGMLAALLLARHGLSSHIVERRRKIAETPRAHAVNGKTIEISSTAGIPAEEIYVAGMPVRRGGMVNFWSTLSGTYLGGLPYERQDDAVLELAPYRLVNISQPRFEAILENHVTANPGISLSRGMQCTGFSQDDRGVTAIVQSGEGREETLKGDYLIAADGAGSPLRRQMGIEMEGPDALQHFMTIHFHADLSELIGDKPGILHWIMEPTAAAALISYDDGQNWVLMHNCPPDGEDPALYDEVRCRGLVAAALGRNDVEFTIHTIDPWVMTAQVAVQYRKHRAFLVGDAAHRFPPAGGLGLNTGVGDAQNLAWKLAAVKKGVAGPVLLDSYEAERKPVAETNSAQSLENAMRMIELIGFLLGPDPENMQTHFDTICQHAESSTELAGAIAAQKLHFDSLRLQIGYSYGGHDDTALGIDDYRPQFRIGDCLPHCAVNHKQATLPLIELVQSGHFTLLLRDNQEVPPISDERLDIMRDGIDFTGNWSEQLAAWDDNLAALLVRPDGHIAAHFLAGSVSEKNVSAAIARVLANQ
ncbi:MAG: FAD-dependent monooxygenase [Parvularculales bacterium]